MKQYDRKLISGEWIDLVLEYHEIFLEPSPKVLAYYQECKERGLIYNIPENVEDLCNLRLGFECESGWIEIIREFCEEIRSLIKEAKENGDIIHYKTNILKEKFGECLSQGDFYGDNSDKYWNQYTTILLTLRKKSAKTCERTGRAGSLICHNFWCKTLCEEEAEKWINYR